MDVAIQPEDLADKEVCRGSGGSDAIEGGLVHSYTAPSNLATAELNARDGRRLAEGRGECSIVPRVERLADLSDGGRELDK